MNNVQLIGRLTKNPETRQTNGGTTVVALRIAVERPKRNGEEQPANYFTVIAFNGQADNAAQYLVKGREVAVSGRLEHREWETDGGSKRSTVEVIANGIDYLRHPLQKDDAEAPAKEDTPDF